MIGVVLKYTPIFHLSVITEEYRQLIRCLSTFAKTAQLLLEHRPH